MSEGLFKQQIKTSNFTFSQRIDLRERDWFRQWETSKDNFDDVWLFLQAGKIEEPEDVELLVFRKEEEESATRLGQTVVFNETEVFTEVMGTVEDNSLIHRLFFQKDTLNVEYAIDESTGLSLTAYAFDGMQNSTFTEACTPAEAMCYSEVTETGNLTLAASLDVAKGVI